MTHPQAWGEYDRDTQPDHQGLDASGGRGFGKETDHPDWRRQAVAGLVTKAASTHETLDPTGTLFAA